jgi:hypothetical protein
MVPAGARLWDSKSFLNAKPILGADIIDPLIAHAEPATPHQIRVLTNGLTRSPMNNRGRTVETVGEGSPMRWRLIPA